MAGAAAIALASPTAISHPAEKAGAAAETAFYKVRKPARGSGAGGKARRRSRAAAASREAGAVDAAGPSQVTPRPRAWPRGGAKGGGARARASAYKRAAPPFPPERARRRAPSSSFAAVLQCLHPAA